MKSEFRLLLVWMEAQKRAIRVICAISAQSISVCVCVTNLDKWYTHTKRAKKK